LPKIGFFVTLLSGTAKNHRERMVLSPTDGSLQQVSYDAASQRRRNSARRCPVHHSPITHACSCCAKSQLSCHAAGSVSLAHLFNFEPCSSNIYDQNIVFLSVSEWVSRGLTSHSTLYRLFRGRFLQARWPNQQRQSTEWIQLATGIGFGPTRTTPLCNNMNCRQPPIG